MGGNWIGEAPKGAFVFQGKAMPSELAWHGVWSTAGSQFCSYTSRTDPHTFPGRSTAHVSARREAGKITTILHVRNIIPAPAGNPQELSSGFNASPCNYARASCFLGNGWPDLSVASGGTNADKKTYVVALYCWRQVCGV